MSPHHLRPACLLRSAMMALAVTVPAVLFAQEGDPVKAPAENAQDAKELDSTPTKLREKTRVRVNQPEEKVTPETAILRFETFNAIKTKVADDGALVIQEVKDESRAARQGLKVKDRIVEIDGQKLESPKHAAAVLTHTVNQPYHIVKIQREGQKDMEVVIGTHMDLLGMLIVPDTTSRPVVHSVKPDSPAAEAGVRKDDIIVGASGRETDKYKEFGDFVIPLVRKMSPGQELNLRVIRDAEEAEVTLIRPDEVKLPLLEPPSEPSPEPQTVTHADPQQEAQPQAEQQQQPQQAQYNFLSGFMGLPTAVPFVGGILPNGFATTPSTNAAVAVLQPDPFSSLINNVGVGGVPFNNSALPFNNSGLPFNNGVPVNTGINVNNPTSTTVPDNGTTPHGASANPTQRRALPQQNQKQNQNPTQPQANPPAGNVPGHPGVRALPQQQLKQVLPNQNAGNAGQNAGNARQNAGNANPGTATANPGAANANPQGTNANGRNVNAQQRGMQRNNRRATPGAGNPVGVVTDPTVNNGLGTVNNGLNGLGVVNNGLGVNNGLTGGINPGITGFGTRGFVVVSTDNVSGSFVRARLIGLMPGMSYTLAVHQLGDIGAVNQNSAGPIVAILGIVVADASGQTEVTFPVNTSIQPSLLLGRAVSLLAGTNGTGVNGTGGFGPGVGTFTNTAAVPLAGVAITDNTVVPGVTGITNGFNYQACGVFGYASSARFNNNGGLIVP